MPARTASDPNVPLTGDDLPWPPEIPFPDVPEPSRPVVAPIGVVGAVPELETDAYRRLYEQRTVFVRQRLDETVVNEICAELLSLDAQSARPITVVVNSPGGPLGAVFAVLDTIAMLHAPVDTLCLASAAGTAAAIVAAGTGTRRATPSARIVLRLEDDTIIGAAHTVADRFDELQRRRRQYLELLAAATGQPIERLVVDTESGEALDADEAFAYGLIDEVVQPQRRR